MYKRQTVYKKRDDSVLFKNVARIEVEGDTLILTDIMGDARQVKGCLLYTSTDSFVQ